MKICTTCGAENEGEAQICATCGSPLFARAVAVAKMTSELDSIDEPPAELVAAKAAAEAVGEPEVASAFEDQSAAEDATVALEAPALLAELDRIAHEKAQEAEQADAEDEEEAAATIAMEMPAALAALDDPPARDPGVEDETVVIDDVSQEQLKALASGEMAAIPRDPAPQPEAEPEVDASAAIGDAIAAAMADEEPAVEKPDEAPDTPEANPDLLSAMIDETLAEGSKRIQAIPEEAPSVDIEGVSDVPSVAATNTKKEAAPSGGRGGLVAVAIVVILIAAAIGAVFVLPMFGVQLPFEVPFGPKP